MRLIGSLDDLATASRFAAWLKTRDLGCEIEAEDGAFSVWVHDEDQVKEAREAFDEFIADPSAERYALAETAVKQQERATRKKPVQAPSRRPTRRPAGGTWNLAPWSECRVTAALIVISVVLTGCCIRGFREGSLDFLVRISPVFDKLTITMVEERAEGIFVPTNNLGQTTRDIWRSVREGTPYHVPTHGVGRILRGEVWRLVTPIFLHFSILHILFNLLWLRLLGGEIETKRGRWRVLGLVLLLAITSNVGQYAATGSSYFGGMSGVVYGLFGYIWMRDRYWPGAGMSLPPQTAIWMMAWFFLCWTGMVGSIANWAHTYGLAGGMLVGLLPVRHRIN